jgi:nucleoside-diphosphate-sugar epimerase
LGGADAGADASGAQALTVAVTGPTGTFGFGLVPLLEDDDRISRVVGIARRPFDPAERGWTKMEYRQGDVRDSAALEQAFDGADVVVHLAFLITGTASRDTARRINVEGTLNAFRAAAAAGVKRFVYASSVAAYGFHGDNPVGMTEEWPVRPARHLFYAQEKAELEHLLDQEAGAHPDLDLYLLRPPIVLGPHAVGAKEILPGPLAPVGRRLINLSRGRAPVPLPVPVPSPPVQFIHEADVGQALLLCVVGAGPPGAYNITGDGVLTGSDVARELGVTPLPLPNGLVERAARVVSALPRLPFVPPFTEWVEALSHPPVMDSSKAKRELGWDPRYSGLDALRATLRDGG